MSVAEIIAVVTAITALIAAVATGLKSRSDNLLTAKRDELAALRVTIDELQERNTQLYSRVKDLEVALETERCKRRELEQAVTLKDARIAELEDKVRILERQLEELEQTPKTRRKTGELRKGQTEP